MFNKKKLTTMQIVNLVLLCLFFMWYWGERYLMYEGRNFPQESQLQYSEGILDIKSIRTRQHLLLIDPMTKNQTEFSCSYKAYDKLSLSACSSPLKFPSFAGQKTIIGWYYQDDFLGFHNPLPQVVTLQVGDNKVLSYEKTVTTIQNINHGRKILSIFMSVFVLILGIIFHIGFGKEHKNPK